jgi:succinate dehydrogenase hydrophobic anchor subunit
VIADDYLVTPRARQIVRYISIVFMLTMIAIGLYVVWTL